MAIEHNTGLKSPVATSGGANEAGAGAGDCTLSSLHDAPIAVEVRLGKARLALRQLLSLRSGDVVTLDTRLGDPAEVLVGDKVVALGEIVQVGEELGIRVIALPGQVEEK